MSVTASRTVQVLFSGDVTDQVIQSAADNPTAFGKIDFISLASGDNLISVPSVTGFTIVGVMIIPPSGNTNLLKLKGSTTDTGTALHKTDPTSLAFDTTTTSFYLNAATTTNGVRMVWS
jgi:hypothetical protein